MSPKMTNAFLWKWQRADDGQVILSSLILYNVGTGQQVWSGAGPVGVTVVGPRTPSGCQRRNWPTYSRSLLRRTGCRTVYLVYIQPGRWVSAGGRRRNTLQEDAARIYGALSVAGVKLFQQSFGFSFMRGTSRFYQFQTHFSWGEFHEQTPQIFFIIFLLSMEIIKQGGTDFSVLCESSFLASKTKSMTGWLAHNGCATEGVRRLSPIDVVANVCRPTNWAGPIPSRKSLNCASDARHMPL